MEKSRTEHLFLVRFWREPGPDASWRGCVDHVATGHREYISGPHDVSRYIERQLDCPTTVETPLDERANRRPEL